MKYAIISDIHSNLEALNAVLESIEKEGVTDYICVGDIVGYGANPVECTNIIRTLNCPCVLGNHDAGALGKTDISNFNSPARMAIEWTVQHLDEDSTKYLDSLPYVQRIEAFTIVHANLKAPEEWGYIFSAYEAEEVFQHQTDTVCFIGHSHIPCIFTSSNPVAFSRRSTVKIKSGHKYIINVGSVGQPRDNNPAASYVIYDLYENVIKFVRVNYDIKTAQQKIIDAGLPEILAIRLGLGR